MPTTWDVQESDGDYTNLADALSNASTVNDDTISINGVWTADDDGTHPDVVDSGITILTTGSSRHAGFVNATTPGDVHRLIATTDGHALTISGGDCIVDGLIIAQDQGSGSDSDEGIRLNADSITYTIKNCIILPWSTSASGSNSDGIFTGKTGITVNLEQCIIYGFERCGFHYQGSLTETGTFNFNSCFIWDCGQSGSDDSCAQITGSGTGVRTVNMFNSIFMNGGAQGDINQRISGTNVTWNITQCICSDTTITTEIDNGDENLESRTISDSDSPGAGDWVIVEGAVTDPWATADLRIKTNAENDAEDIPNSVLTAHTLTIPTTDIAGNTRGKGATDYDCGPFTLFVASGLATIDNTIINQAVNRAAVY